MGTNFYWIARDGQTPLGESDPEDAMSPVVHIGKRSAAGWYCWDCRLSLSKGGEAQVHSGLYGHYDACPKCGKKRQPDGYNAAMVELGYAKTPQPPDRLTGVQGASSFSWAQDPQPVLDYCTAHLWEDVIEDEYGRELTGQGFLWMLDAACPIRFTDSIGHYFC